MLTKTSPPLWWCREHKTNAGPYNLYPDALSGSSSHARAAVGCESPYQTVTYGGMSKQPTSISAGMLIFRNITARGFWLSRWSADQQAAAAAAAADNTLRTPHLPREMMDELYSLVKRGKLKMPAREVSLDEALHAIASPTAVGTRKLLIRF